VTAGTSDGKLPIGYAVTHAAARSALRMALSAERRAVLRLMLTRFCALTERNRDAWIVDRLYPDVQVSGR
jgi:hypothetical protein